MAENPEEFVRVAAFSYLHEAEAARILLGENGIDTEVADGEVINADPLLSNAVGGVKVLVRREDIERAQSILAAGIKERTGNASEHCPDCDSHDVQRRRVTWKTILVGILTLGVYYPGFFREFRCMRCGARWSYYRTH